MHREFKNLEERRVESTFEFESNYENPESIKNILEHLLASFDMTFTMTDLDHDNKAEGKTYMAKCNRLADYKSPGTL